MPARFRILHAANALQRTEESVRYRASLEEEVRQKEEQKQLEPTGQPHKNRANPSLRPDPAPDFALRTASTGKGVGTLSVFSVFSEIWPDGQPMTKHAPWKYLEVEYEQGPCSALQ